MDCEFCTELVDYEASRFARLYRNIAATRIVAQRGPFVAMPTLGQLRPHSLLILPAHHVETMATMPADDHRVLTRFVLELGRQVAPDGHYILFEHGARCNTGGGCGVFHAHLHLVPTAVELQPHVLLPTNRSIAQFHSASSVTSALSALRYTSEYLLVSGTDGRTCYGIPHHHHAYPSQYLRQRLVAFFGLTTDWDWRSYTAPEQSLLDTLRLFGTPNAA